MVIKATPSKQKEQQKLQEKDMIVETPTEM